MKFFILILLFSALFYHNAFCESPKKFIREGNKCYKDEKYIDAEVQYKKALETDSNSLKANFNLANSLYKQGRFEESGNIYQNLSNQNIDKEVLAKAYHNLGNSLLKAKKYPESIDAYKKSLRLKPDDLDTKYNLEYAKKMLIQEQQQQKNQKNQQNQDNKDQKQDQNKQDQNKDKNKDNQQSQADNQNEKDKQDKNRKEQQQPKISKEDAQRMLNAIRNDEKKVQKDVRKQLVPSGNRNLQKKW